MQQMPHSNNQNQALQVGQVIQQLYQSLSFGQKRRLLMQYVYLYGSRSSFYRKISGECRLRRSEQNFFEQHFNQNLKSDAI